MYVCSYINYIYTYIFIKSGGTRVSTKTRLMRQSYGTAAWGLACELAGTRGGRVCLSPEPAMTARYIPPAHIYHKINEML